MEALLTTQRALAQAAERKSWPSITFNMTEAEQDDYFAKNDIAAGVRRADMFFVRTTQSGVLMLPKYKTCGECGTRHGWFRPRWAGSRDGRMIDLCLECVDRILLKCSRTGDDANPPPELFPVVPCIADLARAPTSAPSLTSLRPPRTSGSRRWAPVYVVMMIGLLVWLLR
jgi:hypothetical protein